MPTLCDFCRSVTVLTVSCNIGEDKNPTWCACRQSSKWLKSYFKDRETRISPILMQPSSHTAMSIIDGTTGTDGRTDGPLLGLLHSVPPPLLLQPPAGLLQLGEGVWRRVGGHGRVLDEGVRGLDLGRRRAGDGGRSGRRVVAQLRRHPGVHGARPLHRRRPRGLAAGGRSPGAAGAAAAGRHSGVASSTTASSFTCHRITTQRRPKASAADDAFAVCVVPPPGGSAGAPQNRETALFYFSCLTHCNRVNHDRQEVDDVKTRWFDLHHYEQCAAVFSFQSIFNSI